MKTERMVLLVTPEEKAKIATESTKLGVSASAYVRRIVALLDAEDVLAAEELALLGPELGAMADRLENTFADFRVQQAVRDERWASMETPDYREKIRQEVLNDPTIDWDRVRAVFGGDTNEQGVAAE